MDYDVGADLLLYSTSYYIQQNCNVCIISGKPRREARGDSKRNIKSNRKKIE